MDTLQLSERSGVEQSGVRARTLHRRLQKILRVPQCGFSLQLCVLRAELADFGLQALQLLAELGHLLLIGGALPRSVAIALQPGGLRWRRDLPASGDNVLLCQLNRGAVHVVPGIESLFRKCEDPLAQATVHQRTRPRQGFGLDDAGEALPTIREQRPSQRKAALRAHDVEDLCELRAGVVREVEGVRDPPVEPIVLRHEVSHVRRVACEDHDGRFTGRLVHRGHELLDGLLAELVLTLR
mmetsp:Transcript_92462/g.266985  ORF Transcript_92462/g.266985 Transcript_92462/m.266985 type:complete len:240 (+) Transcript_92462:431-1150(+)